MARSKSKAPDSDGKRLKRPLTDEALESYMVSIAMDEAAKRILDGSASSQLLVHFLKLGSTEKQLELEKLRRENNLLESKRKAIDSEQARDETYKAALAAFRGYSGAGPIDSDEEYDEY